MGNVVEMVAKGKEVGKVVAMKDARGTETVEKAGGAGSASVSGEVG